ncbi:MAG: class C sortase [Coriobacteriaceae bacterium]|nr:class C sortase [Coriobacteriaceae bacterium]
MATSRKNVANNLVTGVLVAMLLVGMGLVAYPSVSNWWNQRHASRAVGAYAAAVDEMSQEDIDLYMDEARSYNEKLVDRPFSTRLSQGEEAAYRRALDVDKGHVLCQVRIDKINVDLPVFHGTEDEVIQSSIGHLEGTSLPVGGDSTHSVLVGHRGLPSAELFSKLDQLREGDTFSVITLGKRLWYEVDQILVVKPEEMSALGIEKGKDLCTLLTCTPYGINTHRLLVRGHRVDGPDQSAHVTADAVRVDPILVACAVALPLLLIILLVLALVEPRREAARGTGSPRGMEAKGADKHESVD